MWRVSRQNCHGRKLRSLLPNTAPKSFFRMASCEAIFFCKIAPSPIFGAKWPMWRVSRQNCHRGKLRLLFCLKHPRNRFSKWRILRRYFFMKPPHHLFSGPNGLCGAFWGKFVANERFNLFYQKCPRNCFSWKHVFSSNFFTTLPPHLFSEPKTTMAHFEEKVSRQKTSLTFA